MSRICYFLGLSILVYASCGQDNRNRSAVEKMIQQEVEERVATYRGNRNQRCYQDAVKEASVIADSVLLIEARMKRDTASKPPRPDRPARPAAKKLRDSLLKVAPLLSEDSIRKILRRDSLPEDTLRPRPNQ